MSKLLVVRRFLQYFVTVPSETSTHQYLANARYLHFSSTSKAKQPATATQRPRTIHAHLKTDLFWLLLKFPMAFLWDLPKFYEPDARILGDSINLPRFGEAEKPASSTQEWHAASDGPKYYSHDYSSLPLGLLNECELRGSRDVKSISGWSKDGKTAKTCASLDEFEMCRREL